jgi:hypothetical protein
MSFIENYGPNSMPICGNPEITLFNTPPIDISINNLLYDFSKKKSRVQNLSLNINNALDFGIMYRHTNFDKNSVILLKTNFNDHFISEFDKTFVSTVNLNLALKSYQYLTDIIVTLDKSSPDLKLCNLLHKISFNIGGINFDFTYNQLVMYNVLYKQIIFESRENIIFKLPLSIFEDDCVPIVEYLDINLCISMINDTHFTAECFVIEADTEEIKRLNQYYKLEPIFRKVYNFQQQITYNITKSKSDIEPIETELYTIDYPIKELVWTYEYTDVSTLAKPKANTVSICFGEKKRSLTYHQCTKTNQISNHGRTLDGYYSYCFATNPNTRHPSGEIIRNHLKLSLVHDLECNNLSDVKICYISVKVIVMGIQVLCFYRDNKSGKLLCKFEEFYDAFINNKN